MDSYIVICVVAFIASGLTLFSGFGLGTILLPAFGLFFPIDVAITLTAIVHFLNNLFKLALLGKHANKRIVIQFGIPSVIAALIGAFLLAYISDLPPIYEYHYAEKLIQISPVKLTIALLLFIFSLIDIIPSLSRMEFDAKYLPLGGLLSGFFGGLSGNQGALRSAFLIRAKLEKESFIATGVVIACFVDISRLSVYSEQFISAAGQMDYALVSAATLCAFLGAFIGNKLVKKVTIRTLQLFVAAMLMVFSVLLGAGFI